MQANQQQTQAGQLLIDLAEFQREAMELIAKKQKAGKFTYVFDHFESSSKSEVEARYGKTTKELEVGYTNSKYYEHVKQSVIVEHPSLTGNYHGYPKLFYRLLSGRSASEALLDLVTNPETIMFIDCQAAVLICQYYAILRVIQRYTSLDQGAKIFDNLFNHEANPLTITRWQAVAGTAAYCDAENNNLLKPLNPLSFFIQETSLQLSCSSYYSNHVDYMKKFPLGNYQGEAVICVSMNPPAFMGYDLGSKPLTEQQLRADMVSNFNKTPPKWMRSEWCQKELHYDKEIYNRQYKKTITPDEIPGFLGSNFYSINTELLLSAIKRPIATVNRLKSYLELQRKLITAKRLMVVNREQGLNLSLSEQEKNDCMLSPLHEANKMNHLRSAWQAFKVSDFQLVATHFKLALDLSRRWFALCDHHQDTAKRLKAEEDISMTCYNLSTAYINLGKFSEAREYLQESYEIRNHRYGDNDERTKSVKEKLDECSTKVTSPHNALIESSAKP